MDRLRPLSPRGTVRANDGRGWARRVRASLTACHSVGRRGDPQNGRHSKGETMRRTRFAMVASIARAMRISAPVVLTNGNGSFLAAAPASHLRPSIRHGMFNCVVFGGKATRGV